jgi:hypothetical protein
MEKFIVTNYGYDSIEEWIKFNAEIFKDLQEDEDGAVVVQKSKRCYHFTIIFKNEVHRMSQNLFEGKHLEFEIIML